MLRQMEQPGANFGGRPGDGYAGQSTAQTHATALSKTPSINWGPVEWGGTYLYVALNNRSGWPL